MCKTEKKTHTQIFEKNKNLSNAVSEMAGINDREKIQKTNAWRAPNLVLAGKQNPIPISQTVTVSLAEVEAYFQANNYSVPEAKKFFYYNEGRGWLFAENFPVRNWQALAHKWMLNNFKSKFVQNDKPGIMQNQFIDSNTGKDYSEPL